MLCKCNVVEIGNELLKSHLGRVWSLGPVIVSQEPGSNFLSIIGTPETFNNSFVSLVEAKDIIMTYGTDVPLIVKLSVTGDRGQYDFNDVTFDDQVPCRYVNIIYSLNKIELVFSIIPKGKELNIFNGNTINNEQSGNTKPLFWASILKGDIH